MKKLRFGKTVKKRTALKAADYCLDISKLVLAGIVLAGVMQWDVDRTGLFVTGLFVVVVFATLGFTLYLIGNQNKL